MGSRITREYWCDTCGYSSNDEHNHYHNHGKYTSGGELDILDRRLRYAKSEEEKFEELCNWFGFHPGESSCNINHAIYDESIIKCIIKGMRERMIHNEAECECECSAWYRDSPEIADYIEENIPKLKEAYNAAIDRSIQKRSKEMEAELNCLNSRKV